MQNKMDHSENLKRQLKKIWEGVEQGINFEDLLDQHTPARVGAGDADAGANLEELPREVIMDKLIEILKNQRHQQEHLTIREDQKSKRSKETNNNNDDLCGQASLTPQLKALGNPLILNEILSFLDAKNLKSCRLVHPAWNDLSRYLLHKKNCLQMTFNFDEKYKAYFLKCGAQLTTTTLDFISDTLENSILSSDAKFPCQNFYFKHGHINASISRFFQIYGQHLKGVKLSLSPSASRSEKRILRQLLLEDAPNIETLHFENIPTTWTRWYSELRWGQPASWMSLPNLRHLIVYCGVGAGQINNLFNLIHGVAAPNQQQLPFWRQLFQAAVNLEKLSCCETDSVDNLLNMQVVGGAVEAGKSNLVKDLQVTITNSDMSFCDLMENPEFFGLLQLEKLKLIKPFVHFFQPVISLRHAPAISQLLSISKDTLQMLNVVGILPADTVLPVLAETKVLILNWGICHSVTANPNPAGVSLLPNTLLSMTFPVLRSLTLDFGGVTTTRRNPWGPFGTVFPFIDDQIETLRFLELAAVPEASWLANFSRLFPNLTGLTISKIKVFQPLGRAIWTHFREIQVLRLVILEGAGCAQNLFPVLEATFTGFSQAICRKLKADPASVMNVEKWRKSPSILNLTALRSLEITFDQGYQSDASAINKLLSHVTGRFAFQKMPLLSVKVIGEGYEKNAFIRALASVAPYAEVIAVGTNRQELRIHHRTILT